MPRLSARRGGAKEGSSSRAENSQFITVVFKEGTAEVPDARHKSEGGQTFNFLIITDTR